mmetsp:Transcript_4632/g.7971  ORF Transcript_4632/g.7971 Transcript_4632/m.7971 type:complete len:214 (-) Transcript_4632:1134-1775(-)
MTSCGGGCGREVASSRHCSAVRRGVRGLWLGLGRCLAVGPICTCRGHPPIVCAGWGRGSLTIAIARGGGRSRAVLVDGCGGTIPCDRQWGAIPRCRSRSAIPCGGRTISRGSRWCSAVLLLLAVLLLWLTVLLLLLLLGVVGGGSAITCCSDLLLLAVGRCRWGLLNGCRLDVIQDEGEGRRIAAWRHSHCPRSINAIPEHCHSGAGLPWYKL